MATHSFEYRGHFIVIDADGDAAGYWGWSYTINSGTPTPSTQQTATDASEAINDAASHAMRQIDRMNAEPTAGRP